MSKVLLCFEKRTWKMSGNSKNHNNFVSDIDQFLEEFDARNPMKSESQELEIVKGQKIAELRDHVQDDKAKQDIWDKF